MCKMNGQQQIKIRGTEHVVLGPSQFSHAWNEEHLIEKVSNAADF